MSLFLPFPASPLYLRSAQSLDSLVCGLPTDPDVVKFAGLFNQQHNDPRYLLWLLAGAVDSDALVPTKYVDAFIKQFFRILESERRALGC